jgi:hypothetical protein
MPKRHKTKVVDRINVSLSAWKSQAPESSFSGLSYAQAEAALAPPIELREQILALEKELEGLKMQRIDEDLAAIKLLDSIVSSIKGDLAHGKDGGLYRSFGYIRQSERKPKSSHQKVMPVVTMETPVLLNHPTDGTGGTAQSSAA